MMCFASNATQSGRACHRKEAEKVFMDRGYRGHGMSDSQVFISSGVNARLKRLLKRRQAGRASVRAHREQRIARNYLKGTDGGPKNAMLSYARYSMRITLKKIRIFSGLATFS